ncbi:hypothetical protein BS78_05G064400 [Paspalum vaginatum]|nr:hypothetical protein BS78_05G064400 [Paspalum vaginatum]
MSRMKTTGWVQGGSPLKASTGSSSTGSEWNQLPLVKCPRCGISVIRIRSKKLETLDQIFFLCPNNIQGDPTTCGFIRSEEQYVNYLRTLQARELQAREKLGKTSLEAVDESHGAVELKQQVDDIKQQLNQVLVELYQLKIQTCEGRTRIVLDKSLLSAICVGLVIGMLVTSIWK